MVHLISASTRKKSARVSHGGYRQIYAVKWRQTSNKVKEEALQEQQNQDQNESGAKKPLKFQLKCCV